MCITSTEAPSETIQFLNKFSHFVLSISFIAKIGQNQTENREEEIKGCGGLLCACVCVFYNSKLQDGILFIVGAIK